MKRQLLIIFLFIPILARADFPVSDALNDQKHAAIAKSDSGWLVVWEDQRDSPLADVWGQLMDTNGTLVDINFPICTDIRSQCFPAVEWNDTCYLVVWTHDQGSAVSHIYGRFLDWAGDSIDSVFSIAETANSVHPSISWNGEYWLIVWSDYRNGANLDVYGQLMDGSGNFVGSAIPISQANEHQVSPSVSWNGTQKNWLVVWEDNRTGNSDIYGQLIDSTGGLVGSNFPICQASEHQLYPEVVWGDNHWLVAWSDYRSGSVYDIYGRAINSTGTPEGSDFPILYDIARDSYYPRIFWNSTKWVIAWADFQTKCEILRRNVDALRNLGGFYPVSSSPAHAWYPDISGDEAKCIVVWEDDRNGNWDIYTTSFNPLGVEETKNAKCKMQNAKLEIYPNPFMEYTAIKLSSYQAIKGKLKIYDMMGRLVEETGSKVIGKDLSPGIYFVKIKGYKPAKIVKLR